MAKAKNKIIVVQQGEEVKFYVRIDDVDHYNQVRDDFRVTLHYGMQGGKVTTRKAEMGADESGYFFKVDTADMVGKVVAECEYYIRDHDMPYSYRTENDRQILLFVAATHCPRLLICPVCEDEHKVVYERTFETDIDFGYYYLCDCDMNPLVTTEENGEHAYLLVPRV